MENRAAVLLRLPPNLKIRLEEVAREHRRSATMEIVVAIESHLAQSVPVAQAR